MSILFIILYYIFMKNIYFLIILILFLVFINYYKKVIENFECQHYRNGSKFLHGKTCSYLPYTIVNYDECCIDKALTKNTKNCINAQKIIYSCKNDKDYTGGISIKCDSDQGNLVSTNIGYFHSNNRKFDFIHGKDCSYLPYTMVNYDKCCCDYDYKDKNIIKNCSRVKRITDDCPKTVRCIRYADFEKLNVNECHNVDFVKNNYNECCIDLQKDAKMEEICSKIPRPTSTLDTEEEEEEKMRLCRSIEYVKNNYSKCCYDLDNDYEIDKNCKAIKAIK